MGTDTVYCTAERTSRACVFCICYDIRKFFGSVDGCFVAEKEREAKHFRACVGFAHAGSFSQPTTFLPLNPAAIAFMAALAVTIEHGLMERS